MRAGWVLARVPASPARRATTTLRGLRKGVPRQAISSGLLIDESFLENTINQLEQIAWPYNMIRHDGHGCAADELSINQLGLIDR